MPAEQRGRPGPGPSFWSGLIFLAGLALALYVSSAVKPFLETNRGGLPEVSLGPALLYFFGGVAVVGLVLWLIPASKLGIALKVLFAFMFSWGTFTVLLVPFSLAGAAVLSVGVGLTWLFAPRIWLHDLALVFTLVSVSALFGFLLPPPTVVSFLFAVSVYDALAVRFGYMQWMVKRLSDVDTLPAFIIPKDLSGWDLDVRMASLRRLMEGGYAAREFAILGGGDIGLPLLLATSVYFAHGLGAALTVGTFTLLGLLGAYWLQAALLKGEPIPALPPICFGALVGLLVAGLVGLL